VAWGAVEDEGSVEESVGEMVIGKRRGCGEDGVTVEMRKIVTCI
jgi:hypothetical protein